MKVRGLCLLSLALTTSALASEQTAALDAIFEDVDSQAPGYAVAVTLGPEVIYMNTFGLANLEHGIAMSESTVFDVASVSKQFGGLAAVLLVQGGKLEFGDRASKYVPELKPFASEVTLQHLLNHTGGLRDWPQTLKIAGVQFDDVISFEKIMQMVAYQERLNFAPGSAYAYSNTGYNLLAEALARASSQSFRDLTHTLIFEPLRMHATVFLDDYREVIPNLAGSYSPTAEGNWVKHADQLTALASSSLHTTIDDFTHWMINFEATTIGTPDSIDLLTEQGVLTDGSTIPYARGIAHGEYRGLKTLSHGGSWAGFRTTFVRFPEQRLSIAVFANFSTGFPSARANRIADVLLADHIHTEPETRTFPTSEPAYEGDVDLGDFTGRYHSRELDTTYTLSLSDGVLVADHFRNERVTLQASGPDRLRGDQWWFRSLQFFRDADGKIESFELNADRVRHLEFVKVDE